MCRGDTYTGVLSNMREVDWSALPVQARSQDFLKGGYVDV